MSLRTEVAKLKQSVRTGGRNVVVRPAVCDGVAGSIEKDSRAVVLVVGEEFAGILAWCVRGCLAWQSEGLTEPKEVREATDCYRQEEDILGGFLSEHTIQNGSVRVKSKDLYDAYANWAKAGNQPNLMSKTKFGRAMTDRGFQTTHSGGSWYLGIGLLSEQKGDDNGPAY